MAEQGMQGAWILNGAAGGPIRVEDSLSFPKDHASSLLGSGGAAIRDIRKTGVVVTLKKLEDHIEVHMSGTREQVDEAKAMVAKVAHAQDAAAGKEGWTGGDG
eukprot:CAMPEP_0171190622 /NCGR_PEP_ID=MMETSP0790-20130122/18948_1 /TAXON_ID=2925 /ORGANISM="Alexandrium catenella, Strain OF101" /LENGTH=102 /DNA_ID=CAMNT_0011655753 /DNA_START=208 /DNA_END=513 /DNA_ORIENTATION=-